MHLPRFSVLAGESRGERGVILVLMAISLVCLLALLGLAIDAGNLYRAQLALQRAADAAALGTVNYVTMEGKLNVEERALTLANLTKFSKDEEKEKWISALVKEQAEYLAWGNLDKAGYPNDSSKGYGVSFSGSYKPGGLVADNKTAYLYEVTLKRKIDFLIMDLFPFIELKDPLLSASATARRKSANLALILDLSASMRCPKDGDCSCLEPHATTVCPATGRKFDVLADSVAEFMKMFDLENDRLGVVGFNIAAKGAMVSDVIAEVQRQLGVTVGDPVTSSAINIFRNYVKQSYQPASATNVCDGLIEAYRLMNAQVGKEDVSYVMFSDGAPTASRFFLTNDAAKTTLPFSGASGLGNYDYIHHTVEWVLDKSKWQNSTKGEWFAGPSLLMNTDALSLGDRWEAPTLPNPATPPNGSLGCDYSAASPVLSSAPQISKNTSGILNTEAAANAVFDPCVSSLEMHIPGDATNSFGSEYDGTTRSFKRWREMYYHCPIQVADYIRDQHGKFYLIGLGEPLHASQCVAANATEKSVCSDPYENIHENFNRKDVFLARLALDHDLKKTYSDNTGATASEETVEFSYTGYSDYATWASKGSDKNGEYLPTNKTDTIKELFRRIARKVLLKLIV